MINVKMHTEHRGLALKGTSKMCYRVIKTHMHTHTTEQIMTFKIRTGVNFVRRGRGHEANFMIMFW
jgi:hypothetical protein